QRAGISFAAGIYTQEIIATVREKMRLDIEGQIQAMTNVTATDYWDRAPTLATTRETSGDLHNTNVFSLSLK
ncbi:hypothetical protein, partial [Serratia entomophila]